MGGGQTAGHTYIHTHRQRYRLVTVGIVMMWPLSLRNGGNMLNYYVNECQH